VSDSQLDALLADGAPGFVDRALAALEAEPNAVHELAAALHCGRTTIEHRAARVVEALGERAPERLEPILRRLFRVTAATEDATLRGALGRTLPRLDLGRGEAGRLAFVFESWLEAPDPEAQKAAMDALVAIVPQRPELARRVRTVIERRAALGSPTAARHGLALLKGLREF
jgi:hypothetical protein